MIDIEITNNERRVVIFVKHSYKKTSTYVDRKYTLNFVPGIITINVEKTANIFGEYYFNSLKFFAGDTESCLEIIESMFFKHFEGYETRDTLEKEWYELRVVLDGLAIKDKERWQ
jgi:hypothetical protein